MAVPVEVKIRLPRDMVQRLDKAASRCGMDRTEFVRNATLAELAEVEEAHRQKRLRPVRASLRVQGTDTDVMTADDAPGLGLKIEEPSAVSIRHDITENGKPPAEDPVSRLAQAIVDRLEKKPADPTEQLNGQVASASGWLEKLSRLLP